MTTPNTSYPRFMKAATSTNTHEPDPRLLVRWFVQYNPLFTLSAACVLGGVLLVGRAVGDGHAAALAFIVEVYQWLVIAVAGLLYRRLNEHRAGVILGVIAAVLLIDPTLQLSALAGHGAIAALWVVSVALKVAALSYAFCLRLNASAKVLPVVVSAFIASLPSLKVSADVDDSLLIMLVSAIVGIGAFARVCAPTVTSTRALGDNGAVMFPRLMRAVAAIALAGVALQGANAVFAFGGNAMVCVAGALCLVGVMFVRAEFFSMVVLVVPATLMLKVALPASVVLPFVGTALLVAGLHRRSAPVWLVGVVTAAVPAIKSVGPGIVAVVLDAGHAVGRFGFGTSLVVFGFVLLPLGVVAHRRLSARLMRDDALHVATDPNSPATSAAPLVS